MLHLTELIECDEDGVCRRPNECAEPCLCKHCAIRLTCNCGNCFGAGVTACFDCIVEDEN